MTLRLMTRLAGLLILISSVANVQAQSEPAQTETQTQAPAQTDSGVARISLIHGDVSTQRGDSGDWATAAQNAPIVAGDRVSTAERARAEVQLDHANILRLEERTQANVTSLNRTQIQIQLARGMANYSVLKESEADVEIDAPNLSVHPRRGDGRYQITVISDDQAEVVVRKGDADISTPTGSTRVKSGQMITVRGSGNDTQYQIADAPSRDDFDRWANDRDNTIRHAQSWSRTNNYYVGSEDLDTYGRWTNVPDYGQVWVPTAASGWAPYREGRWVWEPYWGWTWVSDEPWGWAPYHYGRWFMYENSWVWWPGQSYGYRNYRPIWAPAYVSFFGFGGGGFEFGFGNVGWLPIGPCDGFYPWWGGYRSRFNVVNVTNITNVTNIYNIHNGGIPPLRRGTQYSNLRLAVENDRMRRAISTVPAHDFGRGRITAQPVSREQFRNGRMVAGNLPVVPNRESLLAGERRAAPPTAGRGGQPERFFSTNHNLPAKPQSFDREAAEVHNAIQRDGKFTPIVGNQRSTAGETNPSSLAPGRTVENPGVMNKNAGLPGNGSNQHANVGSNQGSNQNSNPSSNQTWRRIGPPVQQPNTPGAVTGHSNPGQSKQTSGENSDWRRSPNSGAPRGSAGNGSPNSSSPAGRVNNPVERREPTSVPQGNGNQDWRRINRPSEPVNRGVNVQTEAPASRNRTQREQSMPTQDRGNDWRRMPARPERTDSVDHTAARSSASETQRDSGTWRQSAPRDSGREVSRPPLDMRQPIVTPRSSGGYSGNSGGGSYGGGRPAPSAGGGYGGGRPAPSSGGSYGGGRPAPSSGGSYGGGRPAPSGGSGGGHSAPSHSGGEHSSGSNSTPHRGNN